MPKRTQMISESSSTSGNANPLRLAMLGMIAGNGHPYSWSAIINGFNSDSMANCPYPVITQYLAAEPAGSVGINGARVTHLWTDNPGEASTVADASLIPFVVDRAEDVIGQVDAVFISTDDGDDHVRRARPFVEAGLPVFIDKPLATTIDDLRTFVSWKKAGHRILSSSGLRYAPELESLARQLPNLGSLRWLSSITCKTWERYGIHALEPVFKLLGPGFVSVRLESLPGQEVAHLVHRTGVQITIPVIYDGGTVFATCHVCGVLGQSTVRFIDTYRAFRGQMLTYIEYVRSGLDPYPFLETVEMMAVIIAGVRSRDEKSRRVEVTEILSSLSL